MRRRQVGFVVGREPEAKAEIEKAGDESRCRAGFRAGGEAVSAC
jgi:hypothetical protein